ncbi:MAG: 16S rRNA (cytosine(1402)-N(4))-methyltransferase RsmH [Betaproteobacteria bacterium]|nr:16S rRNA (cytosine(1402)-N(4))-methyltransferase RsmH [Betaproteobacteria bacterium]
MRADVHEPVLLAEAIEALAIAPSGIYLDCTFGRGGHSLAILSRLGNSGRLIALDRDPDAIESGAAMTDARLTLIHSSFGGLDAALAAAGVKDIDGVLFDLGVSSPQLSNAERGMSFRLDGPLDMRMDTTQGATVSEWLSTVSESQLHEVIKEYGEERFAGKIARAIVAARSRGPILSTRELAQIVASAVPSREPGQDPATRTFQALRIFINQELEELSRGLAQALGRLRIGGRMVAISFHSLEDRIVKRFFQQESKPAGIPDRLPLRAGELPQPRMRTLSRAIRPSMAEVARNVRSRSAVMRVAERIAQ